MTSKPKLRLVKETSQSDKETVVPAIKRQEGELWTAQQRQMHSLHYVVSYRASFKPELPDFCINRYTEEGDVVLDPFSGRGTTALQANLLGRVAYASDVNPLGVLLTKAKVNPARLDQIVLRLNEVDFKRPVNLAGFTERFAPFYHPDTYRELINLRSFIQRRRDPVNRFIELLAVSRLHGHSKGFFSVYSFPQISIPPERQEKINRRRHQQPEYRSIPPRIIKKAALALRDGFSSRHYELASHNKIEAADARNLHHVPESSVNLIVTSPPFLDKVDYITDNWLENWFVGFSPDEFRDKLVMSRSLDGWCNFMSDVLKEMARVLKPGARAVIEVGEVEQQGKLLLLDEYVARLADQVSVSGKKFVVEEIMINRQQFTKLANCFKVDNNKKGTNTNRLVVIKCKGRRRVPKR